MTHAVVVPLTPLLFRDLGGQHDPVPDLRAAALAAVRELAGRARVVALCPVGAGAPADYHHDGVTDPLSVLVARHLLAEAGYAGPVELRVVAGPVDVPGPGPDTGLLVLGEGSARRTEGGPGYLDPRAEAFDDELGRALERGDGAALAGLDQRVAEALLVTGRHTLAALGRAVPSADAEVRWRGHPYGVTYLVAVWR